MAKTPTTKRALCLTIPFLCTLLAFIFTLLIIIGNLSPAPVLRNLYFARVNTTNIVPSSTPNAAVANTIAQALGLHDFYQVGLWNYCEGYYDNGINITSCSKREAAYAFDPVEIIESELLIGASVAIPTSITSDIARVRIASRWIFGLYMTGVCLSFVTLLIMCIGALGRRWAVLPVITGFLAWLMTTAASVVATVLWKIVQNVFNNATEVNVIVSLSTEMLAMEWLAVAFSTIALLFLLISLCTPKGRKTVEKQRMLEEEKWAASNPSPPPNMIVNNGGFTPVERASGVFTPVQPYIPVQQQQFDYNHPHAPNPVSMLRQEGYERNVPEPLPQYQYPKYSNGYGYESSRNSSSGRNVTV
ncbi:hypothetical protein SAICODRAFT_20854 [Saitoella complicata NRRL Y-17804]|uniref:Uncharacterized protein n=1 Tax=Saitoella complicata (strain BCRC 22490 / CBS 7301 / JCM 7358 / NBRC 10748 / NRRL Y-17804) TaxID=698492 RepID=A0A0E9NPH5_SAICN|nr:uncharacterized protein SAICODRAFT_20854 [Saitoella complicata NRRL Y-17804]ODQ51141.1 hypothetical protein SAICODRAFT_20854 [Saitoella complicata NRRL Y-17804]GAO51330.1 hypothetical protein G7K_5433-t1 [Saitoella complicata NRRL Y-17804]